LVRSNPCSSSSSAVGLGDSFSGARLVALVGLRTGDLPLRTDGGGLLLGGGRPPSALDGLVSNVLAGVPMYCQNGAGELVGISWLGR
jgi:hypothetical protein